MVIKQYLKQTLSYLVQAVRQPNVNVVNVVLNLLLGLIFEIIVERNFVEAMTMLVIKP